jgi:small subunit ribosomal protein S35
MATALQGFRLTVRSSQCRPHAQRYLSRSIGRRRAFSTAHHLLAQSESDPPPKRSFYAEKKAEEKRAAANSEYQEEFEDIMRMEGIVVPDVQAPTKKKLKNTFLNMGDPEPFETDDFEVETDTLEDLTSLAHGELEHHREKRHYARLAAWEMPLLSSMLHVPA